MYKYNYNQYLYILYTSTRYAIDIASSSFMRSIYKLNIYDMYMRSRALNRELFIHVHTHYLLNVALKFAQVYIYFMHIYANIILIIYIYI
jgi:hypothetical protein